MTRWAWAEVDLGAVEHNVRLLRAAVAPADVWAVVKADAYGHGAVDVARSALRAGAGGLCVALVQEGVELREAGVDAPILVLSEQPPDELPAAVQHGLIGTVYSHGQIEAWAAAGAVDHPVHLKVDTGMRRVGAELEDAVSLGSAIERSAHLRLDGVFTHLAVADEPGHDFNELQLRRFDQVLARLREAGIEPPRVHAANSAGAVVLPASRYTMVRAGIALYGIAPGDGVRGEFSGLRPVLSLHAKVAHVKAVRAGEAVSYGLRHTFDRDTVVATLPIGYADGVARRLSSLGAEVLVGGRRCPMVGTITMDQTMVDVGPEGGVRVGDAAVLIGAQGEERIGVEDWAQRLGTIGYEVLCAISDRVPRHTG